MRSERRRRAVRWIWVVMLALAGVGCDDASEPAGGADATVAPDAAGSCQPDEDRWNTLIQGKVERYCGECHAGIPQFGAGTTLTDFAGALTQRALIVERLTAGTMPPPAVLQPPAIERAEIVAWADCTTPDQIAPNPGGFEASAALLPVPPPPPPQTASFDIRAFDFAVPDALDHYECFNIEVPTDEPRLLQRIEPLIDDTRVVHHIVLMRGAVGPVGTSVSCVELDNQVYAWAPGTNALAFPDGGLLVQPREQFHLQVHYYNPTGIQTVDRSGVRVFHRPLGGEVIGMAALGSRDFVIPAGSRHTVEDVCMVEQATTVLASTPHMHEIGAHFEAFVIKADGTQVDLVTLDGWAFESQFIYSTPVDVGPGDRIMTRCQFENMSDEPVEFGSGTGDEMCFNFMYHTPPLPPGGCGGRGGGSDYDPGECLGAGDWAAEEFDGPMQLGTAPMLAGGDLEDGVYVLEDATIFVTPGNPYADGLDVDQSAFDGAGMLVVEGETVRLDIQSELEFARPEGEEEIPLEISVAGTFARDGAALRVAPTCGDGPTQLGIEREGEAVRLRIDGLDGFEGIFEFEP